MIKISIDFDGTLSNKEVQDFVSTLTKKENVEVWIVTRRFEKIEDYTEEIIKRWGIINLLEEYNYLFEVAEKVGIPKERIIFTNIKLKYFTMVKEKFHAHLDDDPLDITTILVYSSTKPIKYHEGSTDWKDEINEIIQTTLN